jgi:uncharacterized protein YjbI with pentapeptide repeats
MPSIDDVQQPEDLDALDKDDLIAFLKSDREDRIELWNAWREANDWQPVDLGGADLGEAHLEKVDLSGTRLDGAFLFRAHLKEANLAETRLGEAFLFQVHLEGANLAGAHLAEADLRDAHLEKADLYRANLERASLLGAHLEEASLRRARLDGALLNGAHLDGATLEEAHLEGAILDDATLENADLRRAHLGGAALSTVASLRGVRLYQTYFWGVLSLRYEQLLGEGRRAGGARHGSTVWEETEGRFGEAKDVFKSLKGYFEDAGDYEGANWAYVREQVMEKLMRTPRPLRWLYPCWRGRWDDDFCEPGLFDWLRLEFSEKLAGYGDSLTRPLVWLLVVIVVFAAAYALGGLITDMPGCSHAELTAAWQEGCRPTRSLVDGLVFSLGALTTADTGVLQPYRSHVSLVMTLEALLGIALTGLIGFVLGNKLRYS